MNSKPAVVMELGAQHCRFGFSSERSPRTSILTLVGRPNDKTAQRIPDLREYYVGNEAELKASILNVRHSVRRGMVDSWDDMVLLWRHGFRDLLRVTPEEHPVILSEAPLVPPVNREKMTQVLFETFQVPAMYVALQQLLTLLSIGRTTGLVLDAGFDATYIVPIYDGYAEHSAVTRMDLGGRDLSEYMARLLKEQDLSSTMTQKERAIRIKEQLCYVAQDYSRELEHLEDVSRTYQLPDGQVITVAEERFRCPEALFQPTFLGLESKGIHNAVANAIKCSTITHQKQLYENIVLTGGSARFPGLALRLKKEISKLVEKNVQLNIRDPVHNELNVEPSAWLGGAILATLPSFQSMWITRQEYDEEGPSIVHRKCDQL